MAKESGESFHAGRGRAATRGWRIEQLVYTALKEVFSKNEIIYQYLSDSLYCTPDFVVIGAKRNIVISITSGPDIVAQTFASSTTYPFYETIDELFDMKTSHDPKIDCFRDPIINLVFGRKEFWKQWLLCAFESLFDHTYFPQYIDGQFLTLDTELRRLFGECKKKYGKKEVKDRFPEFLRETVKTLPDQNFAKKIYVNLIRYFKMIKRISPKPETLDLWRLGKEDRENLQDRDRNVSGQIEKYCPPFLRPSFRWFFLVHAIFNGAEYKILRQLAKKPLSLEEIMKRSKIGKEGIDSILEYFEELGIVQKIETMSEPGYMLIHEQIRKAIALKTYLDPKIADEVIHEIVGRRGRELKENFDILKDWRCSFKPIRDALTSSDVKRKLSEIWNDPDIQSRNLYRRVLWDMADLKQRDMRSMVRMYGEQVPYVFYTRDFTPEETETACDIILGRLQLRFGDYERDIDEVEGRVRAIFAKGRIWADINSPKVLPYNLYIEKRLIKLAKKYPDAVDVKIRRRVTNFLPGFIEQNRHLLMTYPDLDLSAAGAVESHFMVTIGGKSFFIKSRYAVENSISHRCPEEGGRVRCLRYVYMPSGPKFDQRKDIEFIFIPDGFWRVEDLFHLLEAGFDVCFTIEEFISTKISKELKNHAKRV